MSLTADLSNTDPPTALYMQPDEYKAGGHAG